MTLIEAVASGKEFRRKAYKWTATWHTPSDDEWCLTSEDILAYDWEVRDDKRRNKSTT